MKKFILPVIIVGTIAVVGYFFGFDTLFLPGAVKKVRSENVEGLKQKADEAEKRFKDHVESAEKAGNAFEKLGKKLLQKKDWTPAIASLEKAISYGSGGARAHFMLGQAYANRANEIPSKKDVDKSLFHYRRPCRKTVISLMPNTVLPWFNYASRKNGRRQLRAWKILTGRSLIITPPGLPLRGSGTNQEIPHRPFLSTKVSTAIYREKGFPSC